MSHLGYHKTWEEAFDVARVEATKTGMDIGLEKWASMLTPGAHFRTFRLPRPEFRYGFELRCEVVSPGQPAAARGLR